MRLLLRCLSNLYVWQLWEVVFIERFSHPPFTPIRDHLTLKTSLTGGLYREVLSSSFTPIRGHLKLKTSLTGGLYREVLSSSLYPYKIPTSQLRPLWQVVFTERFYHPLFTPIRDHLTLKTTLRGGLYREVLPTSASAPPAFCVLAVLSMVAILALTSLLEASSAALSLRLWSRSCSAEVWERKTLIIPLP